ncbi:unnamed protein product [Aureobasidium vineae]|uniref:Uncharacterized protein n=1 Tax=Aureobasidium vineae TaxID=2773715 RepID=A0A9N8JM45_9PEZI|nr:unnamed protein product [Aureobasidium vineae]
MLNRKELLVVDEVEWEIKGLLSVEYTAQFLGRDGSEREFENHVNDHPSWRDDDEELALPKLRKDLTVLRYPNVNQLAEGFLQIVWDDEGHEWALSSLMERNVALGWPDDPNLLESNTLPNKPVPRQITRGYLRSEKRPRISAEDDDEDDDCDQFTDYLESEDIITYGERCDPHTAIPKSVAHFEKPPVPPMPTDIERTISVMTAYVEVDEVIDSIGRKCVDCNHVRRPTDKTHFSFNLYVIGQRPESPQLFFTLLNQRILEYIPLKLHVYVVPNLSTALSHHEDEMATRPLSGRLPINYAGLPEQPQSHVFLYIDEHMMRHKGPKVVTRDPAMEGPMLEVMHAGSWGSTAEMLLTYFTLCTETPKIMAPLANPYYQPPSISASVSLTPTHVGSGPCRVPDEMHLNLTLTLSTAQTRSIGAHTRTATVAFLLEYTTDFEY